MIEHVTPSLIHLGFHYEKKNTPGWLRLVLRFERGYFIYADFIGLGMCGSDTLARWSRAGYTAEEAIAKFPDECAKIDKVSQAGDDQISPSGRLFHSTAEAGTEALDRLVSRSIVAGGS
jgi:hypothetical protein